MEAWILSRPVELMRWSGNRFLSGIDALRIGSKWLVTIGILLALTVSVAVFLENMVQRFPLFALVANLVVGILFFAWILLIGAMTVLPLEKDCEDLKARGMVPSRPLVPIWYSRMLICLSSWLTSDKLDHRNDDAGPIVTAVMIVALPIAVAFTFVRFILVGTLLLLSVLLVILLRFTLVPFEISGRMHEVLSGGEQKSPLLLLSWLCGFLAAILAILSIVLGP